MVSIIIITFSLFVEDECLSSGPVAAALDEEDVSTLFGGF